MTMARRNSGRRLPHLEPNLQISFFHRLKAVRARYLHEALSTTVARLDLASLDAELRAFADAERLKRVAAAGIRGEVFFPVPLVLRANPNLLGYYRLLFGHSQKEFYSKGPFGRFKTMEEDGEIPDRIGAELEDLCRSLCATAQALLTGIDDLSLNVVTELQLLTLGPQLRGGENNRIGQRATAEVYRLIEDAVSGHLVKKTARTMIVRNAAGRTVLIEFFSDPDVAITETMPSSVRPIVSIEVKGGADASNIHNRLGEAEKSHLRAKTRGFSEFWTLLRVELDEPAARSATPTTTRFFNLSRLLGVRTREHREFVEALAGIIGIRLPSEPGHAATRRSR